MTYLCYVLNEDRSCLCYPRKIGETWPCPMGLSGENGINWGLTHLRTHMYYVWIMKYRYFISNQFTKTLFPCKFPKKKMLNMHVHHVHPPKMGVHWFYHALTMFKPQNLQISEVLLPGPASPRRNLRTPQAPPAAASCAAAAAAWISSSVRREKNLAVFLHEIYPLVI